MNNSSGIVEEYVTVSSTIVTIKIVLYSLILVWSLCSNILVLAVIFRSKRLRTNFNYLLANMTISDLVIPCLALPMKIVDSNLRPMEWLVGGTLGNFLCKLCYFAADISPVVSAFSLVIIAVNRYIAIAYPMRGLLTRKRTLLLIATTWVLAFLLLTPYLYTYKIKSYDYTACINDWSPAFDDTAAETIFSGFLIAVVFVIPCIAISVLYSVMLSKLRQNSHKVALMLNNKQYRRRQQKDKNIFIMTVIIMLLYLLLWGPFFCTLFVLTFVVQFNEQNADILHTTIVTVQFLGYLNTAVNPCIYFCFLNNLRQGLKKLLRKVFLLRKVDSLTSQHSKTSIYSMTLTSKKKRSEKSFL